MIVDALKYANKLENLGFSPSHEKAQAEALSDALNEEIATMGY